MNADEIRKAVRPFIPGWVTYPDSHMTNGVVLQHFDSAGVRVATVADINMIASAMYGGVYLYTDETRSADGDFYTLNVPLRAGTYGWSMSYSKNTSRGKFDLYVDGTKVSATALDQYAASVTYNQQWNLSGIVIAADGWHDFSLLCAGHHASSSDYGLSAADIAIYRTA